MPFSGIHLLLASVAAILTPPSFRCNIRYNEKTKKLTRPYEKPYGNEADHIIALEDIVDVYCDSYLRWGVDSLPEWLMEVREIANGEANLCWITKDMNDSKETWATQNANVQTYLITVAQMWFDTIQAIANTRAPRWFARKLLDHFLYKHDLELALSIRKTLTYT
jgi:hypothetical protein